MHTYTEIVKFASRWTQLLEYSPEVMLMDDIVKGNKKKKQSFFSICRNQVLKKKKMSKQEKRRKRAWNDCAFSSIERGDVFCLATTVMIGG